MMLSAHRRHLWRHLALASIHIPGTLNWLGKIYKKNQKGYSAQLTLNLCQVHAWLVRLDMKSVVRLAHSMSGEQGMRKNRPE